MNRNSTVRQGKILYLQRANTQVADTTEYLARKGALVSYKQRITWWLGLGFGVVGSTTE